MRLKQWAAFVLLGLIWSSSFLWIKVALQDIGPFTLVAFRLLIGLAGLLVVMRLTRQSFPRDPKILRAYLVMGAINTAIPFTLISWGETRIASGLASILNGTVPLFTIVIAHFWLHDDKITLPRLAGLIVGFVGVTVLLSRDLGPEGLRGSLLGQLAVIAASVCYATGFTFSRRYLRNQPPVVQATLVLLIADSMLWLAVPFAERPFHLPALLPTWVALVWLGLLGSCLAYLLLFYLINSWGPTRASVVSYIFPVVGLILGLIILNETPDSRLLAGSALVVAGIAVLNLKPPARRMAAAAAAD